MAEGQSTAEIVHLLKVSDRTIERDKKAIREENAISQDPELANIIAGRLVDEAQICIQRIRKFERDLLLKSNTKAGVGISPGHKKPCFCVNF